MGALNVGAIPCPLGKRQRTEVTPAGSSAALPSPAEELRTSVLDPLHLLLALNSATCKLFLGCLVNLPKGNYTNYKVMDTNEFVKPFYWASFYSAQGCHQVAEGAKRQNQTKPTSQPIKPTATTKNMEFPPSPLNRAFLDSTMCLLVLRI